MYNGIQWDTTDNVICVFSKNSACIPIICNLVGKIMFFLTMGWNGVYFQTPNRPLYRNLGEQTAHPAEN
jgi:hypothetical protein